jgi:GNAT superfamily N-acetyltransferase
MPPQYTVVTVPWDHEDAVALRAAMNDEMNERYADRIASHGIPPALAVADGSVTYTALALDHEGTAVGHIAIRWHGPDLEVKRLYVAPSARGTGAAALLLAAVETRAAELGAARLVLQTGDRQPDAVRLYEKTGYTPIPVFPPYDTVPFSLCFGKAVTTPAPGARTPHRC